MENKLAFYREQCGMTQEELAAYVGLPAETIKEAEKAAIPLITPSYMEKIAEILGEDTNDIFPSALSEERLNNIRKQAKQAAVDHSSERIDLEDLKTICHMSAEELQSCLDTLSEARTRLLRFDYQCAEHGMLQTVEVALETIIRRLWEV